MFIVAFVTIILNQVQNRSIIKSNEKENKQNRQIQSRLLEYQLKLNWIEHIKSLLIDAQNFLDFSIENEFQLCADKSKLNDIVSKSLSNSNKIKRKLVIALYGGTDFEKDFLDFFCDFTKEYLYYVLDLEFLYGLNFESDSKVLMQKTIKYKQRHTHINRLGISISEIIESRKFGTSKEDYSFYLNSLSCGYEFNQLESRCLSLLENEYKLAKKILNGTEQNK